MIPHANHVVTSEDEDAVLRALRSGRLTQGQEVVEFEREFAAYTGYKYAVAFSSGTTALLAAVHALRTCGGASRVVVPALTFVADANVVVGAGLALELADVDAITLCLDPNDVAFAPADGMPPPAIAVSFAGQVAAPLPPHPVAVRPSVIHDAAHGLGVDKGSWAYHCACYSLHPAKAITSAEGGMYCTHSDGFARLARRFRDHGRWEDGLAHPTVEFNDGTHTSGPVGVNGRMSELHAALGRSQLKRIDANLARRREVAAIYAREFAGLPLELPVAIRPHAWHLYVVRVEAERRVAFRAALRERGVDTQVHYRPIWEHPAHAAGRSVAEWAEHCPVTARESRRILSLPMWPMDDATVEQVVVAVRAACQEVL